MAKTIQVRVVTTQGQTVTDEAVSVQAPGEIGYLGILYNHAPLVTTIKPGRFSWRRPSGETQTLTVGAGLMEVAENRVTLLTEQFSRREPAQTEA